MASNADAAEMFRTIADLLDLLGEKFKPEAYRRAARSIESLTEDLRAVAARHELRSIPGVGDAIADKIDEYLRSGSLGYFEKLKREVPPGLVELMRLPGVGPKTTRRFWVELGVEGPSELRDAVAAGRLVGMKGFGEKKIELVRAALAEAAAGAGSARRPIAEVYPIARSLVAALTASSGVDRVEVAGSFRRARETVGDLDVLVTTRDPSRAFEAFTAHPLVAEVKMRGDTKETVLLKGGFQVDLRVVKPGEFGSALLYFTGSKDHNVHLRSLARERGLKVNEYGIFREEERLAGATEEDVYAALGLSWIPPELREDRGEIERAARGPSPPVVAEGDLRGDLHVHLDGPAGPDAVDLLRETARRRGYGYVGVVVGWVDPDGTVRTLSEATRERLSTTPPAPVRFLRGVEAATGDLPPELGRLAADYRILRPHPGERAPDPSALAGTVRLIAHAGASTAPDPAALAGWVEVARKLRSAVEVGPGPERLDSIGARQAREAGVALHVPTGLLAPDDDATRPVALGFARRAGASPSDVVNARPEPELSSERPAAKGPPKGRSPGPPRSTRAKARPA